MQSGSIVELAQFSPKPVWDRRARTYRINLYRCKCIRNERTGGFSDGHQTSQDNFQNSKTKIGDGDAPSSSNEQLDPIAVEQYRILRERASKKKHKQKPQKAVQNVSSQIKQTSDEGFEQSSSASSAASQASPNQPSKTLQQRQNKNWEHAEKYLKRVIQSQQASPYDREVRELIISNINEVLAASPGTSHLHVEPYGSYVTGVFSPTSDVDLALRDMQGVTDQCEREQVIALLKQTSQVLRPIHQGHVTLVVQTAVPLLKVMHPAYGIELDITVGNTGGVLNSRILAALVAKDPRFGAMTRLVKLWARGQELNSPQQGTLNSYCLSIMVLFYLQSSKPQIMPPIQELYRATNTGMPLPRSIDAVDCSRILGEVLINLQAWRTTNTRSVARLLRQFFRLYADFIRRYFVGGRANSGFKHATISTFTGAIIQVDYGREYIFRVEDPVDPSYNTARSAGSYDQAFAMDSARFILKQFQAAADKMARIDKAPNEAAVEGILAGLFGVLQGGSEAGMETLADVVGEGHAAGTTVAAALPKDDTGKRGGASGFGELLKSKVSSS